MENNTDVTAKADSPVDDGITVETNVVPESAEPEKVRPEVDKTKEVTAPDAEPPAEPTEPRPINPRTAQRKAEKERLIRDNAAMSEKLRQYEEQINAKDFLDPSKKRDLSKEPDITEYDDVLEYNRDVARYDRKQESLQELEQKQIDALAERAEAVRAEKPDFDEKVTALVESQLITPDIEKSILSSSMGADVSYHLAQFPADLMLLRDLKPEVLPRAMKHIEAFIKNGNAAQEVEKPKVTKAAPPITPPGVTANADRPLSSYTQEEIENMPLSEYKSRFMKK